MSRLVVKKRQSKTTSHPLGSPEWKNKKSTSNKCQQRCGEIGTIKRCYQDRQVVQSLWKTVWQFPKHLNIKLLDDPVILLLPERNIPDKWKHSHTKMCIEIYSSIIHSSQKVETIQMDEKINKMCYIHKEYYAVTKKDGVVIHVTWINLENIQFSRSVVSDSLRPHERQHTRPPCPSPTPRVYSNSCPSSQRCHPAISSSVIPFSSAPDPSQHQGLFQWVNSSHEVAKVLEFQLQHQSFQWTPRTDLL